MQPSGCEAEGTMSHQTPLKGFNLVAENPGSSCMETIPPSHKPSQEGGSTREQLEVDSDPKPTIMGDTMLAEHQTPLPDKNRGILRLWDLGGQTEFYTSHNLFQDAKTIVITGQGASVTDENDVLPTSEAEIKKEGTCNDCVFPLTKEKNEKYGAKGLTSLIYAAYRGKVRCVKQLLAEGADVNAKTRDGRTALMAACTKGKVECVKELIKGGADATSTMKDGHTPLTAASSRGYVECVTELVKAGDNINKKNQQGWTALLWAADNGHVDCVRELIKNGAEVKNKSIYGWTALMHACYNGHSQVVQELIKSGVDVTAQSLDGWTALMVAAWAGYPECSQELIQAGADHSKQNIQGRTALMLAAQFGHHSCLTQLVDAGADVNQSDNHYITALSLASFFGHEQCLKSLVAAGAHLEHIDKDCDTALTCAAIGLQSECVKVLVEAEADPNVQGHKGFTPLMWSVILQDHHSLQKLISLGADVNIQTRHGWTAVMWAARAGDESCVRELIKAGADIKTQNSSKATAWDVASQMKHLGCANILMEAEFHCMEAGDQKPAELENGHNDIKKELAQNGADMKTENEDGFSIGACAAKREQTRCVTAGVHVNSKSKAGVSGLSSAETTKGLTAMHEDIKCVIEESVSSDMCVSLCKGDMANNRKKERVAKEDHEKLAGGTAVIDPVALRVPHVAGLSQSGRDLAQQSQQTLLDICIESIRNTLRSTVPGLNLYNSISQLPLPSSLQSVLLYNCELPGLREKQRNINANLLHAVLRSQSQDVHSLLAEGADVNSMYFNGETALIFACKQGDAECVKCLLEAGADLNSQSNLKNTALITAMTSSNQGTLADLVANPGADMGHRVTAVHQAALTYPSTCLQMLIESGADVTTSDQHGQTALHLAAKHGIVDNVALLVKAGAEINAKCNQTQAALMLAAAGNHVDCVNELISAGADLDEKDRDEHTALDLAALNENKESFVALQRAGPQVDPTSICNTIRHVHDKRKITNNETVLQCEVNGLAQEEVSLYFRLVAVAPEDAQTFEDHKLLNGWS